MTAEGNVSGANKRSTVDKDVKGVFNDKAASLLVRSIVFDKGSAAAAATVKSTGE